jgi:ribosomal protein L40E
VTAGVIPLDGYRKDRRAFDLPPSWDGVAVTWGQWSDFETTMAHHVPTEALTCRECGAVGERAINWGSRPPVVVAETVLSPVTKRTRSGRSYINYEHLPAYPVRDLWAARCRHCGHDTVTDERTGEVWELEPDDYTAEGSIPSDMLF